MVPNVGQFNETLTQFNTNLLLDRRLQLSTQVLKMKKSFQNRKRAQNVV